MKNRIKTDYIAAFKAGNKVKKNLLGVVKGSIETEEKNIGKELSDEEVLKILFKLEKSLSEVVNAKFMGASSNSEDIREEAKKELAIIREYLPQMMSESDIKAEVEKAIAGGASNIGAIMGIFKDKPADKKLVSSIANQLLTK